MGGSHAFSRVGWTIQGERQPRLILEIDVAVWPTVRLSTAQILVNVVTMCAAGRGSRGVVVIGAATLTLSFALLAAPPFHAQAREERLVPPLPIPHVNRTVAIHLPAAASSQPLPRSRPATTAPSPPVPPKRTLVPIND
jgi:hypothetical protein